MLEALLWDVDGTLAETERDGHLAAFNLAFEALGVPWRWSAARYGELLQVAGGRERLLHDMQQQPLAPAAGAERAALAARIHGAKNEFYAQLVGAARLPLREGVPELLEDCRRAGLRCAIATTTSTANVEALLGGQLGAGWRAQFDACVCAEDAPRKKPDPQVYALALERLRLPAAAALAIEDSPAGVAAARAAGVGVIVTRSAFFADAEVGGALAVGPSLGTKRGWVPVPDADASERIDLAQLQRWHRTGG
ncbi:MAG TPA: HAD-IA family hydrolase [Steroidobacteraceae bacterium]|nr:HAD-IA family hydrolase [Steroidobacteraceae bacterium]